jgi:hypothetical protein
MDKMTIEIKFQNDTMQNAPVEEVRKMINDALDARALSQGALEQFVVWQPIILRDSSGNASGIIRFEETWQPNYNIHRGNASEIDGAGFNP